MLVDYMVFNRGVKNDNFNVVTTLLYNDYRSWSICNFRNAIYMTGNGYS